MSTTTNINVTRTRRKGGGKKSWFKVVTGIDRKGRGAHSLIGDQWLNDGDNEVPVDSIVVEGYYQGRGETRKLYLNVTRITEATHVVLGQDVDFSNRKARSEIWTRLEGYLNGQSVTLLGQVTRDANKPLATPISKPSQPVKASVLGSNVGVDTFRDGAFVVWNTRLHSPAMDPQDVRDMALAAGLPEEIVPDYAGDRAIISRVIDGNASKYKRKGWVLSALKRSGTKVLLTIHAANKDIEARETDLPQVGTLEWTAEPKEDQTTSHYNGIVSGHEVGRELDVTYQTLKGKITGTDWTSTLVSYLSNECYAQAWREDGRVYWVPPIGLSKVKELQSWLKSVGVSLAIAEESTPKYVTRCKRSSRPVSLTSLMTSPLRWTTSTASRSPRPTLTAWSGSTRFASAASFTPRRWALPRRQHRRF